MVLPIHLFKIDPFALYSRLLRYRVYPGQGYKELRHDVPQKDYHRHVKVPLVWVVVFRREYAAIKHGKIDGVFHFPDFAPREIVRETRSRCHRLLLSVTVFCSLSLSVNSRRWNWWSFLSPLLSLFLSLEKKKKKKKKKIREMTSIEKRLRHRRKSAQPYSFI